MSQHNGRAQKNTDRKNIQCSRDPALEYSFDDTVTLLRIPRRSRSTVGFYSNWFEAGFAAKSIGWK